MGAPKNVKPAVAETKELLNLSVSTEGWPASAMSEVLINKALPKSRVIMTEGKDFGGYAADGSLVCLFTSPTAESGKSPFPFISFSDGEKSYRVYGNTAKAVIEGSVFNESGEDELETVISLTENGEVTCYAEEV